ncbi:hypothetical protein MTO96_017946 [Rhipicephalus appendiculatus]
MSQSTEDETAGTNQSSESPDETTGGTTGCNDVKKVLLDYDKFVAVATTKSDQRNDSCGTVTKDGALQCNKTTGAITGAYKFHYTYASKIFEGPANITGYPNGTILIELEVHIPLFKTTKRMSLEYRLVENTGDCFTLESPSKGGATYLSAFAKADLPDDKMKECAMQLGQNATVFEICKEK